jgi:hypothetical protein
MTQGNSFRRDCRLTALFYLCLAITGVLGFLLVRRELFVAGDPAGTLTRLVEREGLARVGIALELGVAASQALAAVWFGKLFREYGAFAAGMLTLFGLVNAIVFLASAALLSAALDAVRSSIGSAANSSHLLWMISGHFWGVGNLFFGLWLLPMGWLSMQPGFGHRALGWILIGGGTCYIASALVTALVPDAGAWAALLPIPATIGEFWMIGVLLWLGLRPAQSGDPQRLLTR